MEYSEDDILHIRRAYELARAAVEHGNHPFGALLVHGGEIILEAENTVITERDATGHAELNLVRDASRRFDAATLRASTLYTSTEPCSMCAGAIFWAGIPTVIYGCGIDDLNAALVPESSKLLGLDAPPPATSGPVLSEEGAAIHAAFWPTFRG